jgi:hypothetical protein
LRQQQHLGNHEYAQLEVETAKQQALQQRQVELQQQVAALTVRSNATGRILRRDLDTLLGRYVQIGTTIALVGNEDAKELLVGIGQDDAELFRGHLGRPIEVRPQQRPFDAIEGRLMGVDPRAVVVPPHEALSARHGGPLAVEARPKAAAASDSTQIGRPETRVEYELLSPLFQGTVRISAAQSRGLAAGQLVVVRFRTGEESRARRAWRTIQHWMGQQVRDAADRS